MAMFPDMMLSTHENEQRWEAVLFASWFSRGPLYVNPFGLAVCCVVLFCFAMVLKTDLELHTCLAVWPTTEPHLQLRPHLAWFALSSFFLLWWCQDWTQSMLDEAQSQLLLHSLSLTSMATHNREPVLPCPLNFLEALTLVHNLWYSKWYKTIWVGQLSPWTDKWGRNKHVSPLWTKKTSTI